MLAEWVIVLLIILGAAVVVLVLSGVFCRCWRWREHMVIRWGQPNAGFVEAPCYCYAEVWVDLLPCCAPHCHSCLPRDRTAPNVAPGARYLTGAATATVPPVRDAPPPSFQEAGGDTGKKDDPPGYEEIDLENS